jgi:hypothetical protein
VGLLADFDFPEVNPALPRTMTYQHQLSAQKSITVGGAIAKITAGGACHHAPATKNGVRRALRPCACSDKRNTKTGQESFNHDGSF